MWFLSSKEEKAVHLKMEKQAFGKQMFAGPHRDNGTQRDFNKQTLPGSSLSIHLVHTMVHLLHTVVICDDSPFPGLGPLSTFFRKLGSLSKVLPQKNLLDLDCFQFKTCQRYFGVLFHQIIYTTLRGVWGRGADDNEGEPMEGKEESLLTGMSDLRVGSFQDKAMKLKSSKEIYSITY